MKGPFMTPPAVGAGQWRLGQRGRVLPQLPLPEHPHPEEPVLLVHQQHLQLLGRGPRDPADLLEHGAEVGVVERAARSQPLSDSTCGRSATPTETIRLATQLIGP
jgi:hypothetical protein